MNAVYLGLTAKVSKTSIIINDWEGVGYILYDPSTYSGDYRIYGGISGGSTTLEVKKEAVNGTRKRLGTVPVVWVGGHNPDEKSEDDVVIKYWASAYYIRNGFVGHRYINEGTKEVNRWYYLYCLLLE